MWIFTITAVIGSVLNAFKSRWCFWIWIFSNIAWLIYDISINLFSRAVLDIIQTIICIIGIIEWRKKDHENNS